jgi:thiamine biosynthesis lipoprotein
MASQHVARSVHTETVMGTVVSFDVRDPKPAAAAVQAACDWLHEVDQTFSTYRADSTISRLDRGELLPLDAGADIDHVLRACARLRRETRGAFDVRATGRLDPSAYVKGWAAEHAAHILEEHGLRHFQINAGGDIVVRGDADHPGQGWRIGIRHPSEPDRFAGVTRLHDQAIATTARYERGDHVIVPATGQPAVDVRSVTVVADDLGWADGWSTALFAAGIEREGLLDARTDIEAMIITDTTVTLTPQFPVIDVDEQQAPRPTTDRARRASREPRRSTCATGTP